MTLKQARSMKTDTIQSVGIPIDQLHATVRRYCLSITKSGHDAEDLAQDTWLKALPVLRSKGHQNPEALLLRIAKTTWIDQSRRKDVTLKLFQNRINNVDGLIVDSSHSVFEIERLFDSLVRHLPPLQRTVFLLRDVLDYSATEAAQLLSTTEGAVKAALHRARQSLAFVKRDLIEDRKTESQNSHSADIAYVQALANAYQMNDIAMLIELMQQEQLVPAVVSGIIGRRIPQAVGTGAVFNGAYSYGNDASMLMAA
ncbi:RNA polymerase sigma factor [Paenibacillus harenae]|uniref:RNA polymerase sigma-70 factor (ECF subfamily) n=1 Tax=Paenibacillus harenae TaxID=306543 RepID=A0ABT9TV86_PAEHA|nr:RNA polymerase sigma factor [Paenibacillus harenae]MDQ0111274.1 RNA polymerase sigma-70 factor (ECF subfamily) [Paenibacillus harenae]